MTTDRYFNTARLEVLPYLPLQVRRLLDVGCGDGATTQAIRQKKDVAWAGGVEINPAAAAAARTLLNQVWEGRVEDAPLETEIATGSLDLVLCLDVLEHLVDPWNVVKRLSPLLAPGGRLIISVPNIRNWKFILRLLLRGDFHYRDAGLLDRTHLRFFVRDTAISLATCGGLRLVSSADARTYSAFETRKILDVLTFGALTDLIAKQFIVVVEQP